MTDVEVHIKMLIDMKITVNSEWKTKLCLYYWYCYATNTWLGKHSQNASNTTQTCLKAFGQKGNSLEFCRLSLVMYIVMYLPIFAYKESQAFNVSMVLWKYHQLCEFYGQQIQTVWLLHIHCLNRYSNIK